MVAGAVLVYFAFVFDCVDGQLARYTRQFSKLGAWLDSIFDRSKEYVVFAGLAIGASRTGDPVWLLAGAALALQTTRHAIDFSYPVSQHQVIAAMPQPPIEDPFDGPRPASRMTEPVETEEVEEEDAEAPLAARAAAQPTLRQRARAAVAGDRPRPHALGQEDHRRSRSASASPRSRSPPRSSTRAPSSSSCSPGAASRCSTSCSAARRGRWCHDAAAIPSAAPAPVDRGERARRLPRRRPARHRDRARARPPASRCRRSRCCSSAGLPLLRRDRRRGRRRLDGPRGRRGGVGGAAAAGSRARAR